MAVTIKDVERVAGLARLEFTETQKEMFMHQLNEILAYVEKLNQIDTTNVEPLSHVIELSNVFREDIVRPSFPPEAILQNGPDRTERFFKVPNVIGEKG